jgi:DNA-binding MarR family transcriptional regulator
MTARPKSMRATAGPAESALDRTLQAFDAFSRELMLAHAAEFTAVDLTMAQAKLLYVVTAAGEPTMSEIAQQLGVTISTASGAVEHLVSTGFLSRSSDPANRRQVRVSITPEGSEALEQLRELSTHQLRVLFERLGEPELDVIQRAIRILTNAVSVANAEPSAAAATPSPNGLATRSLP